MTEGTQSKRIHLLLITLSVALIAVASAWWLRNPSPDVKTVDNWISLLNGADNPQRRQALGSLQKLGPRAASILLDRVRQQNPLHQQIYGKLWKYLPARVQAKLPKPKTHDFGDSFKYRVGAALSFLGPDILPGLLRARNDHNWEVREIAVSALIRYAGTSDQAFDHALKATRDPSAHVRIIAVNALPIPHRNSERIIAVLIRALSDDDQGERPGMTVFIRAAAARRLGEMGAAAQAAVPMLRKVMQQQDSSMHGVYTSVQAAVALWRIELRSEGLVSFLSKPLQNPADYDSWPSILTAFAEMGPAAKEAVPDIKAAHQAYRDGKARVHFPMDELVDNALRSVESNSHGNDEK